MRIYYFGCRGEVGHYLHDPKGGRSLDWRFLPWGKIDGGLCPDGTRDQGITELHQKDGWTALAFWDYSIDKRPGSNSVFFYEDLLEFDQMVREFQEHFPDVVNRFNFPIIEKPNGAKDDT
jgi:hypothetical protein